MGVIWATPPPGHLEKCKCTYTPPGLGRGAILPAPSHSVFYGSPQASVCPTSSPERPSPARSTPPLLHAPPSIAMVCSLLTPQWAETMPGSRLSPALSLADCGAQEMPPNQAQEERTLLPAAPCRAQMMRFDQKSSCPNPFDRQNQSIREKQAQK